MRTQSSEETDIYLFPYHSEPRPDFKGCSGQFAEVERAISAGLWPYDNGDDPSFCIARQGGRLTWGVCRQDARTAIIAPVERPDGSLQQGAIAVYFSYTGNEKISYRISAVATVEEKLDHRAAFSDFRLKGRPYINTLIKPGQGDWLFDETDRPKGDRHGDWLWRLADHRGLRQGDFNDLYSVYRNAGQFSDRDIQTGKLLFARNYVLFSADPELTYIVPNPPGIAFARRGQSEIWSNKTLRKLILGTAEDHSGRGYLRIPNPTNRNVHRQVHFRMNTADASAWRAELIRTLKVGFVDGAVRTEPRSNEQQRSRGCGR